MEISVPLTLNGMDDGDVTLDTPMSTSTPKPSRPLKEKLEFVRYYQPHGTEDVPLFNRAEIYLPPAIADTFNVMFSEFGRATLCGMFATTGLSASTFSLYGSHGSGRETALRTICYSGGLNLFVVTNPDPKPSYITELYAYVDEITAPGRCSVIAFKNFERAIAASPILVSTLVREIRLSAARKITTVICWSDRITTMPYLLLSIQIYTQWMEPPQTKERMEIFKTLWKKTYPNEIEIALQLGADRFNELVSYGEYCTPLEITTYFTRVRLNTVYSHNDIAMKSVTAHVPTVSMYSSSSSTAAVPFLDTLPDVKNFQSALTSFPEQNGTSRSMLTTYLPRFHNVDDIVATHAGITQAPQIAGFIRAGILRSDAH